MVLDLIPVGTGSGQAPGEVVLDPGVGLGVLQLAQPGKGQLAGHVDAVQAKERIGVAQEAAGRVIEQSLRAGLREGPGVPGQLARCPPAPCAPPGQPRIPLPTAGRR